MKFTTPILIDSKKYPKITHTDKILSLGSCFSTNIGEHLISSKINCLINPYGIMYNPSSIAVALDELMIKKVYREDDLFEYNNLWSSWMHHGDFSNSDKQIALSTINSALSAVHKNLESLNYLFITFGTAWVYKLKQNGQIVSNCHKVPDTEFRREKLEVDEIVRYYVDLLNRILALNKNLKIVFAISPIRHIKDGLICNQISKATLHLAVYQLCQEYPDNCIYFPSYEILNDELRDYRFYAEDMVHPSSVAIDYIWEKFRVAFFDTKTDQLIDECTKIFKSFRHRPINSDTIEYRSFLERLVIKMETLMKKNPTLDYRKEIEQCLIQLNK